MSKYRVKEVLKYCVKIAFKKLKYGVKIWKMDTQLDFESNCLQSTC